MRESSIQTGRCGFDLVQQPVSNTVKETAINESARRASIACDLT